MPGQVPSEGRGERSGRRQPPVPTHVANDHTLRDSQHASGEQADDESMPTVRSSRSSKVTQHSDEDAPTAVAATGEVLDVQDIEMVTVVSSRTVKLAQTTQLPSTVSRLEKYEIGAELGRGAIGRVRLAHDPLLRREVAVKSLHRGNEERARTGFVHEAQITGQLEHPNIVPIYEMGVSERDELYFAMKKVRGGTLRQRISEARKAVHDDRDAEEEFPLRERLEVLRKVLDAMGYAHECGVIHRDLKPENIMVGDHGEVLVMDWGLARIIGSEVETASAAMRVATDRAESASFATLPGTVAGTPAYMSPEQARGEIDKLDERSDVFALGCVLYELLTLEAPYRGDSLAQVLAMAAQAKYDPVRVRAATSLGSHRAQRIPEDLVAITEMAMSLQQRRRYQSVVEMRADLDAYLEGKPTSARGWGALERGFRFVQAHPAWMLAASLAVVFGLVVAVLMSQLDAREQSRQLAVAEKQRLVAEQQRLEEQRLAERLQRERTEEQLHNEELQRLKAEEQAKREEAERIAAETQASMARAREAAALGRLEEAQRELEGESREQVEEVTDEFSQRLQSARNRGIGDANFREELGDDLARYLAVYNRLIDVIAPLAEFTPSDWDYIHRGLLHRLNNNYDAALADYNRAIELNPNNPHALNHRAMAHFIRRSWRASLDDLDRAIELDPSNHDFYTTRGRVFTGLRQLDEAITEFDRAIALHPNNPVAYHNRALALQRKGDFEAAIRDYSEAIRLHPRSSVSYHNRGTSHSRLGEYELAINDFDRAIELDPDYTAAYGNRANARIELDDWSSAIDDLTRAIELEPESHVFYRVRGTAYFRLGNHERALADYRHATTLNEQDWNAWLGRGSTLIELGRTDEAISALQRAYRSCPHEELRVRIAQRLHDLGGSVPE